MTRPQAMTPPQEETLVEQVTLRDENRFWRLVNVGKPPRGHRQWIVPKEEWR